MNGLRYIRNQVMNLTMDELASKLNITKQAISLWENGQRTIPENRLQQLSELCGIPKKFFQIKEITEEDILEINHRRLVNDIQEYEKINQENELSQVSYMDENTMAKLDINKLNLQIDLLLRNIKQVVNMSDIFDEKSEDIYAKDIKRNIFLRFTDLVEEYGHSEVFFQIIRAMELYFKVNVNEYKRNFDTEDYRKDLVLDNTPLVQELVQVLNKYQSQELNESRTQHFDKMLEKLFE